MATSLLLYLDTNHLSRLARFPNQSACVDLIELIRTDGHRLGLTFDHVQELSDPNFESRSAVGALLDSVNVEWAPFTDEVFDREVEWAFEFALTGVAQKRTVFNPSFVHVYGAPQNAAVPIAQMIDELSQSPDVRKYLPDAAEHGRSLDARLKRDAATIRNPEGPILERLMRTPPQRTRSGIVLSAPYPPEEILKRVGGLAAFPSYQIFQRLAVLRLNDVNFRTEINDLFDEWHACYVPYVDLMLLDRRTAARYHDAKLPNQERVLATIEDAVLWLRAQSP